LLYSVFHFSTSISGEGAGGAVGPLIITYAPPLGVPPGGRTRKVTPEIWGHGRQNASPRAPQIADKSKKSRSKRRPDTASVKDDEKVAKRTC